MTVEEKATRILEAVAAHSNELLWEVLSQADDVCIAGPWTDQMGAPAKKPTWSDEHHVFWRVAPNGEVMVTAWRKGPDLGQPWYCCRGDKDADDIDKLTRVDGGYEKALATADSLLEDWILL